MAGANIYFYKNDGTSERQSFFVPSSISVFPSAEDLGWTRSGYELSEWNGASTGSGTSYNVGDTIPVESTDYYAIWAEDSHEVRITYKGSTIASMDASGTKTLETAGTYCEGDIDVEYTRPSASLQSKTVSPSLSQQTISPDSGYDGLSSVTVNAMPSGTAGTPVATKGAVSNNSVSVTPSVTNTTGYITGGTVTGTAVTVSASELVSGTKTITSAGTTDVTNYASASVASGTEGTPTASKGTVSNNSVSVTPSVTNTSGYISGGTHTGTAVTVSASELVSGTKTISASGTTDVTNYASASVAAGSATTPATTITANPTISVSNSGLITASVSGSQSVTPTVSAGYVSSGTAGTVSVSGSNTSQLTVYNGAHHQPSSGYTVTVSLTNPINPSRFYYCDISEQYSAADGDAGYSLGRIESASGSTSVTVPASLYGVFIDIQGDYGSSFYSNNISVTGGVSYIGWDNGAKFEVTGNGTITIDNVEYDDDD